MAKKTDIKICRFVNCKHDDKRIDITKDDYKAVGSMYYHSDCYEIKSKSEWKDENTKKDLQYIKCQWELHINKTVVYSQLFRCLNELIAREISSDYLVFVLDYVIKNKLNLRFPAGFKYYVDKNEIKEAYQKLQYDKQGIKKPSEFTAVTDSDNAPKFNINIKEHGFKSILGGGKK